jgi:hypothetical protein
MRNQVADKFDTIHMWHVDVEQNDIRTPIGVVDQRQCSQSAVTGGYRCVPTILQHVVKQLEHERLVVNYQ